MDPKRYKSYFMKLDNVIYDPQLNESIIISSEQIQSHIQIIAITHSVGIIKALNYFHLTKQTPLKIIAMDPPNISIDTIKLKLETTTLSNNLKGIYEMFLINNIKISDYKIFLFRNIKKSEWDDKIYFCNVCYYDDDTHYPYMIKRLRDKIIKLL